MKVWKGIEVHDAELNDAAFDLTKDVFKLLERELLKQYPLAKIIEHLRERDPARFVTKFIVVGDWEEPTQ